MKGNDEIHVTNMWLRGLAEQFTRLEYYSNIYDFIDLLQVQNNPLNNLADVDKAVDSLSELFSPELRQSLYKVKSFVKNRLAFYDDFYTKDLEEKQELLASICCVNFDMMENKTGTINNRMLYNIAQLVAKELSTREVYAELEENDPDLKLYYELSKQLEENTKTIKSLLAVYAGRRFNIDSLNKKRMEIASKLDSVVKRIQQKGKLETSDMDIVSDDIMDHLQVETAVNTVLLMAYNNLITSNFSEEVISYTDVNNLNFDQIEFFGNIDISSLKKEHNDSVQTNIRSPRQKVFLLDVIRDAITHNCFSYSLPTAKNNNQLSYKDIILEFNCHNVKLTGRLDDFYKLFTNEQFTNKRDPAIITLHNKFKTTRGIADPSILFTGELDEDEDPDNAGYMGHE